MAKRITKKKAKTKAPKKSAAKSKPKMKAKAKAKPKASSKAKSNSSNSKIKKQTKTPHHKISAEIGSAYDVIVIGGGPAGSTAASYMARDGHKVLLLDKDKHPRHRIGESLLPSMMPILKDFNLIKECDRLGFARKSGATYTWGKGDEPWHLKWKENSFLPYTYSFHVERAPFDLMLLNHARKSGVDVREETKVTEPIFADGTKKKIVGVKWQDKTGKSGEVRAKFVVDCSGGASAVGKVMSERVYDDQMKQVAFYSYFDNVKGPGSDLKDHIVITTCPYGWFWWIPINSKNIGYVSCGLVSGQEFRDQFKSENGEGPEKFFQKALDQCPRVKEMMGPNAKQTQPFRTVMDWSYVCKTTAGDGFFLCGDSAAFLDPLISTGVSLAMLSAYSAALCINTILKDPSKREDVQRFYMRNYSQMYEVTRDFLHYFYAGATTKYKDELFWKGRQNLRLGENVGAQQAFTYFTAMIPGNPHPAVGKQVTFFQKMLKNVEFPKEKLEEEFKKQQKWGNLKEITLKEVTDQVKLKVNGTCEKSFVINEKKRHLVDTWGITYDIDRPVLSNTASWLMGANFYAVDEELAFVMGHLDGKKTWAEAKRQILAKRKSLNVNKIMKKLCEERLVLKVV